MLKFVVQLYEKPIVRLAIQKIIEEFRDTIQNVSEHFLQQIKSQLPSNSYNFVNCQISILENIDSEYKRFQYLRKSKYFISPQSFFIGELYSNKRKEQNTILTVQKCEDQIIPICETLKTLLELPGFYEKILSVLKTNIAATYIDKTYTSLR